MSHDAFLESLLHMKATYTHVMCTRFAVRGGTSCLIQCCCGGHFSGVSKHGARVAQYKMSDAWEAIESFYADHIDCQVPES